MRRILILLIVLVTAFGCSKSDSTITGGSNYSHQKNPGTSAGDLLSAGRFESIKIEIQYMPGFQPDAAALNHLTGFLGSLLNKPGGIQLVQKEITAVANTTLTVQDIIAIEKQNRTVFTTGNQLALYFLYTNGIYSNNNVLGVAYYNTSICMFGKRIHDNSGGIGQASRTKVEATVLEHEFGHLLGLVNIGSPMLVNHHDGAHSGHCNNSNCLMYFEAQTTGMLGDLVAGPVPSLDANCLDDLKANGGK